MSMIYCRECGKEVSDLAEKCPNCGAPIKAAQATPQVQPYQPKEKNSTLGVLALIFSILGCTFIVGIILAIIDLTKKDGRKKTLSIIALVICGIWLLIAIAGNSRKDDTQSTYKSSPAVESETKTENNAENKAEVKTERENETPAESEEQKAQTKDKYYVGDTWQNKYVNVSFDDCGEYESDNQFIQPADGNKYIYAKFTFENIGKSDTTVGYWDFDCYADGYACDGTYGADDAAFSQTLSSGRKITGSVYFEVSQNATEIEFEYSPSFWTSEKIVFVYQ